MLPVQADLDGDAPGGISGLDQPSIGQRRRRQAAGQPGHAPAFQGQGFQQQGMWRGEHRMQPGVARRGAQPGAQDAAQPRGFAIGQQRDGCILPQVVAGVPEGVGTQTGTSASSASRTTG